jgi:hypothetical protein
VRKLHDLSIEWRKEKSCTALSHDDGGHRLGAEKVEDAAQI